MAKAKKSHETPPVQCGNCQGSGRDPWHPRTQECGPCGGKGWVRV